MFSPEKIARTGSLARASLAGYRPQESDVKHLFIAEQRFYR
jgi:hypothetical protein